MINPAGTPIANTITPKGMSGASTNGMITAASATIAKPAAMNRFDLPKCSTKRPASGIARITNQPIKLTIQNACFITADMRDANLVQIMVENGFTPPFDLVLSDMAPKTTGIRAQDQARSLELCELALDVAKKYLKGGGHFVTKLFHSEDFEQFRNQMREMFAKVEVLRPKSTRKESKEVFLIGFNRKLPPGSNLPNPHVPSGEDSAKSDG